MILASKRNVLVDLKKCLAKFMNAINSFIVGTGLGGWNLGNNDQNRVSFYADHCFILYSIFLILRTSSCQNVLCFERHYESKKMRKQHLKLIFMPHLRIKISFTILSNKNMICLETELWTIRMCTFINKSSLYILTLTFAYEL